MKAAAHHFIREFPTEPGVLKEIFDSVLVHDAQSVELFLGRHGVCVAPLAFGIRGSSQGGPTTLELKLRVGTPGPRSRQHAGFTIE